MHLWVRMNTNEPKFLSTRQSFCNYYYISLRGAILMVCLIMEGCAYSLIWTLRNLKCVKKSSNIKVWLEQRMFNNFIQWYYFHKRPFSFHNAIFFMTDFFGIIGYRKRHIKNTKIFTIFQFFVYEKLEFV
jgi:triacylglycerol esterase/lipase EstA (alpha/beta hydrolase family)